MKKAKSLLIFSAIFFLIIFLIILSQVLSYGYIKKVDYSINEKITKFQTSNLIESAKILGALTDTIPIIIFVIIIILLLYFKYDRVYSKLFVIFFLMNSLSFNIIKNLLEISRPLNILIMEKGFAYPSGHSTTAFFLFGFLLYLSNKYFKDNLRKILIIVFSILPIIIGFSRIYLNAHWFSDVLGGAILGLFWLPVFIYTRISVKK